VSFELKPAENSTFKRKRVGRGHGSGNGKTAGKGHKGQKARSGGSIRWGFEGGQMPLQRRVPKRGFNNIFATKVLSINIGRLNIFESDSSVSLNDFVSSGLANGNFDKIKILGNGNLSKKLTIEANMFSKSAKEKIEKLGGIAKVV
jgi:large subunit ribosomal protein L15